ncbi:OmpP1/FadL family transporter [Sorangium cellulosum]|uniref:OmpP1/FadL family transporter n=1 Tax=Sorangium cellulosum TaxID=56 RepID=UPI001F23B136|nr:outer membrane protein transport protein [Sorangium cellulosum]
MQKPTIRAALLAASTAAAIAASPGEARGAGVYVTDRGVRPLARGGAFIAGGDDLGAIAYNPAGVYEAGTQILFDVGLFEWRSEYTRQALLRQVDPNTGEPTGTSFVQTMDPVTGSAPVLPIPTLAASFQVDERWVVWGGVWAPYAALASYPEQVRGMPAPQRYALFTIEGSALAFLGAGAAYAPSRSVRLGAGLGALVGTLNSRVALSGCVPERMFCAPEDPEWDMHSELDVGPIVAPTGQLGALLIPSPRWRIGASFQLPVWVRAPATMRTRLPAAPVFERASQEGEDADVSFELPWILRAGVEVRPTDDLRVELGLGVEGWGMHDEILVEPDGVVLRNVAGFPEEYRVPPVALPRKFESSFSARLGGEYTIQLLDRAWDLRAGLSVEQSAVPPAYLSVITLDAAKVTAAAGVGVHLGPWRFDVTYAHVFVSDVLVDPRDARLAQVSPVQANPPRNPNTINGGAYSTRANVLGLGLAYTFEAAQAEAPAAKDATGAPARGQ